ncbi:putative odorant receptor 92a isoform X2 [Choristoneura fumiferana]|uniref:putative odorant receptor 92a isoform X2 n=1 Tax=Choristoneura fumiferana TaxID=7141 RepID=UPI003D15A755
MSEFSTEPMFRDTYTIVLRYFRNNLIDVLDDMPWLGKLSWLQLLVYILAVGSHTGGVLERIANGADMVQLSGDLSATLVLWQVTVLYVEIYGKRKLIKKLILNLEALWSSDDKLRLEMEEIKRQSVKSIYKWISLYNTGLLITSDLLLVNVSMNHLRTLFVILQDDLKNIVHSNEPFEETATSRLKRIIPKHANLLQLMAELSEAFGAIFLIHLAFFSGTMCFFGFAARVHCSPESIKNLLASSFILICIYSCCSYGQDLTDASLDVANAAYEGPWHLMSHEYRLCILFIMLRSQKAYYIRSTSFTNISLQSFTKILNVTWSFLSLIDKVYED